MQQAASRNTTEHDHALPSRKRVLRSACLLVLILSAAGCGGDSNPEATPSAKPFTEVSLSLHCSDSAFAKAITPAVNSWATRTGAKVTVRTEKMIPNDDADVAIISAGELGAWAERGELVPVPATFRALDHPFQWGGVLPVYREQLIEWGGQAQAMPLGGDGLLIVYRADRLADPRFMTAFRQTRNRDPGVPNTWEEFAALACAFAEIDGTPSLPTLTGAELADLVFRVAVCYDRPAMNETAIAKQGQGLTHVSFLHDPNTGDSRITTPGFRLANEWLGGLVACKCIPSEGAQSRSPVAALLQGEASMGVLSLRQLGELRENGVVPARFGIAPLPGTATFIDPTNKQPVPSGLPNYVPYYSGGLVGVVRTRCRKSDAGFDLLAEIGSPTRSLEWVSNPNLGIGPFRAAHLERERLSAWLSYGFDAERSRQLLDAMRQYIRTEVKNPGYGLRGPDRNELSEAAAVEFANVLSGKTPPNLCLDQLQGVWNRLDAKTSRPTLISWRKRAVGLN
jgi:ABC-type glycerol-3-phosphate transport system substrate-binding protein